MWMWVNTCLWWRVNGSASNAPIPHLPAQGMSMLPYPTFQHRACQCSHTPPSSTGHGNAPIPHLPAQGMSMLPYFTFKHRACQCSHTLPTFQHMACQCPPSSTGHGKACSVKRQRYLGIGQAFPPSCNPPSKPTLDCTHYDSWGYSWEGTHSVS